MRTSILALVTVTLSFVPVDVPPARWGATGHEMAARAAVASLPSEVPDFFRAAREQLVFLDPEPDRWRVGSRVEMREAWSYDHFINLENVPEAALAAPHRYAYLSAVREEGNPRPEEVGLLPFRIVELYQRLVTEWSLWRRESDPQRRAWIEDRILNDAGLLGHYVTDGSQPHHTTIHYDGWARSVPNPDAYSPDRGFHGRFETEFVDAHVSQENVSRRAAAPRSIAGSARAGVMSYLQSTHTLVEELYRLDRIIGFDPDGPSRIETVDFAAERLASGASMLAVLWLSAWEESR
jgi:hypothetical protein